MIGITSDEAKEDLKNYHSYMMNTELNLDKLIKIEEKYYCFGGTPQMVSQEISSYIKNN